MKELLYQKIEEEYQQYKNSILDYNKEEIYKRCYEIDTIVNLYEIFIEKIERLPECILAVFLNKENILLELYDLWLKKDDSNYRAIEIHIEEILKQITEKTVL